MSILPVLLSVCKVRSLPIDAGSAAINRGDYQLATRTRIIGVNPANASGTITSIEIWANGNMSGVKIATFYSTGENQFSTRDYETIGYVTAGSKQTFSVDLDVQTGDYLGLYWADGRLEVDESSDSYWYLAGDYIPCTSTTFTVGTPQTFSVYGTGTT